MPDRPITGTVVAALLLTLGGGCFSPDAVGVDETGTETDATIGVTSAVATSSSSLPGGTLADESTTGLSAASTEGSSGDTEASEGTDSAETESAEETGEGSTTSTMDACAEEGPAADSACPEDAPYCFASACMACPGLPEDGCARIDPARPVCDVSSGACSECSAEDDGACRSSLGVCIDGECGACTEHEQCESGVCLLDEGTCLAAEVTLLGVAGRAESLEWRPQAGVTVSITNVPEGPAPSGPTESEGIFRFEGLAPGTLVDVELELPQTDPVFVPAALATRTSFMIPNAAEMHVRAEVVRYAWLGEVAYECGIFPSVEEAWGGGAINPYFIVRSTVVGRFVDDAGEGVPLISAGALQATLGEWVNFDDNLLDTDPQPTQVCFLDEDEETGRIVGTSRTTSGPSGRFVMFRVRNQGGDGRGPLTVRASGFDDVVVNLTSTGNIAHVVLERNDEPIVRDFAADVYPIFRSHGCEACHQEGGMAGGVVRNGYAAQFTSLLSPWDVWQNIVGPGLLCGELDEPVRVCVDDPTSSLLVTLPVRDTEVEDAHPVNIFTSVDDPSVQVILQWIEQGALPPTSLQFATDIYPLFTKHGCVGCHSNGGPPQAVREGVPADWAEDAYSVWSNLVSLGTTCAGLERAQRICVDQPEQSTLIQFPLSGSVGLAEAHPNKTFGALTDPDMQRMLQWIAQGALFEATCEHRECDVGEALSPGCSACVTAVCELDPFCCTTAWDAACVHTVDNAALSACASTCGEASVP